ncbi:hypothetical protein ACFRCI_25395 [Streptomyces sp. NPDC056638]|uniref:hypothetical protein n=1 Tax=Streptomyces sp. NPDC056638 TaxID=3345887 RepID=UPI00368E7E80
MRTMHRDFHVRHSDAPEFENEVTRELDASADPECDIRGGCAADVLRGDRTNGPDARRGSVGCP